MIVDDDPGIAASLRHLFGRAGHEVTLVQDGRAALRSLHQGKPDAVVLDIGLDVEPPSMDRWTVLERIRDVSEVPVLMLSVLSRETDKVRGLRSGADDYVTKPFSNDELVARVEALLRRAPLDPQQDDSANDDVYDDGQVRVDPDRREVRVADRDIRVTPTEFRLLHALVSRVGAVLTGEQLLVAAWDDQSGYQPQRVKFAMLRLRRKLGWGDPRTSPLEAVRGFGYRYRPPEAPPATRRTARAAPRAHVFDRRPVTGRARPARPIG